MIAGFLQNLEKYGKQLGIFQFGKVWKKNLTCWYGKRKLYSTFLLRGILIRFYFDIFYHIDKHSFIVSSVLVFDLGLSFGNVKSEKSPEISRKGLGIKIA